MFKYSQCKTVLMWIKNVYLLIIYWSCILQSNLQIIFSCILCFASYLAIQCKLLGQTTTCVHEIKQKKIQQMKEIYCIQVLNILAHYYTCLTSHFIMIFNVRYKDPKDKRTLGTWKNITFQFKSSYSSYSISKKQFFFTNIGYNSTISNQLF